MAADAPELSRATWRRVPWCAEADAALGDQIAGDRAAILGDVAARRADLYRAEGPGYAGWVVLRFADRRNGAGADCHVLAVAGSGLAAALADLERLCAAVGVLAIRLESESPMHHRLYERLGFREGWRTYLKAVRHEHEIRVAVE